MQSLTTHKVKISVENKYQPEHSDPMQNKFVFSYLIHIENLGEGTIQLLRRRWVITDSCGLVREVEGEGVVGQQPVLKPGETYRYSSWCQLFNSIGKMQGHYLMVKVAGNKKFKVSIPEFHLVAPFVLN